MLKEGWKMTIWTELGIPLHTRSNDTSFAFAILIRGGMRRVILTTALDTMSKDDALTCGWDVSIWVIDKCVTWRTLALSLAIRLHIEGYLGLFRNVGGLQLCQCQWEYEEEWEEKEHGWDDVDE
jgi:hypothetical protein